MEASADQSEQTGRFLPGNRARYNRKRRIAAKLELLRAECFPAGGESPLDTARLQLAAKHLFVAETNRDVVVAQRATRLAEYLLAKIKQQQEQSASVSEAAPSPNYVARASNG